MQDPAWDTVGNSEVRVAPPPRRVPTGVSMAGDLNKPRARKPGRLVELPETAVRYRGDRPDRNKRLKQLHIVR